MGRLSGKIALVTGGARGLGEAACRAMAAEGAHVAVTDIREAEGKAVAADINKNGEKSIFIQQDVTDEKRWPEVMSQVVTEFGGLDIVVNNAGIAELGTIEDTNLEAWRRTTSINLDGVFLGTQAAVRIMKNNGGGSIINLSSIEGIVGNPMVVAYNASKGGVRLLTKSAAIYCAQAGYAIRINSLHPGFVPTPMVTEAFKDAPPELAESALASTPMQRFGTAEEIANCIVFLASEESSYMTGSELVVDGGFTAH